MHIKRYEATTLIEAIRQVKAELGPDAMIISQRSVRRDRGIFGLLGRSVVEVTAAVDREIRRQDEPQQPRVAPDESWRGLQLHRALTQPLEEELRALRRSVEELTDGLPDGRELHRGIEKLHRVTANLGRDAAPYVAGGPLGRLLAGGLAPRHARSIAEEADASGDVPEAVLARRLERRLVPERPDAPKRCTMIVGATGVGKTTTLAKLAAVERSNETPISLVTLDAMRLGGDDSLRRYAKQIDLPFQVAVSPKDLERARRRSSGARVFVDTAGTGPADRDALRMLTACRDALGNDTQVQLVVSATTKDEDLLWQLERFRPLRPETLVVTKLDESSSLGNVVNLLLEENVPPLAWIADGQRVPEDLRIPEPREFAAQVLGARA